MPEQMKQFKTRTKVTAFVLLLLGNIIFFLTVWMLRKYDRIYFDQFLYQLMTSSAGTPGEILGSAVWRIGVLGTIAMLLELLLYAVLSGRLQSRFHHWDAYIRYCSTKVCRFFARHILPLALIVLILATTFLVVRLDVAAYIHTVSTESDFIEEHYVTPSSEILTFPTEKRNLIWIFLESMESTFANPSVGGNVTTGVIPELSALAKDNVNFSGSDGIGGFLSYTGTTWTAASMVAQTAGVTVKVPLGEDPYGEEDSYLPGIVTLGDVLEAEGYTQTIIFGSDSEFACRDIYFTEHGGYNILDVNSLKEAGRLDPDYNEWWGFEDTKVFQYAKEELECLGSGDEPFNLTLLTADTHFPDGYSCEKCGDVYEEQYANVLSCSSRQVYEFISWVQEQPFYENTTIVLSGDHLTIDPEFLEDIDPDYMRTVYNCIINAPVTPVQEKNRAFASFDMLPTTLAAMGVEIRGDRLGLGTNLFSAERTLTEKFGYEFLDKELQKSSEFYNTSFFGE